jgi:predicted aspartyl protease
VTIGNSGRLPFSSPQPTPVAPTPSGGAPTPNPTVTPAQPAFGSAAQAPAQTVPGPSSLGSLTVEQGGKFNLSGKARPLAKLGVFLLILFVFGSATTVLITQNFTQQAFRLQRGVLFSADLKETTWQAFGAVPEAELELPIETPNGEVTYPFLLDTGAVVSSLPREMADKLGFNLAFLPRQTFKGFGNTTSFAYQADMTVNLGTKKIQLPVVFTEAGGSRALLGRKGLFDKFSIVVDHNNKVVEIKE